MVKVFAKLKPVVQDVPAALRRLASLAGAEKLEKVYPDGRQLYGIEARSAEHAGEVQRLWDADDDVERAHIAGTRRATKRQ